jgi:hypothetical protein
LAAERGAAEAWRKSSYSTNGDQANCCEIASLPGRIRVRDSKCPEGPTLSFTEDTWGAALTWFARGGDRPLS